jgi:glycosyltransferase involved in cell wall biosynthesis
MTGPVRASVTLACYNECHVLELALAAFASQSFRDFELIIADDGSDQDYGPMLRAWAPRFAHPIQHVKHPRHGFHKARIQNRAVHVSRFDWLIFVDQDCLPHRDFVRNHLRYVRTGVAITGRRGNLAPSVVPSPEQILRRGLSVNPIALLWLWMRGKAKVIEQGYVAPVFYESSNTTILGCNLSLAKSDLVAVNGFNEEWQGIGWEDTDLEARLRRNGVRIRNLRGKVVLYHVMHPLRAPDSPSDWALLQEVLARGMIRASRGLDEIRDNDFQRWEYGTSTSPSPRR